MERALTILLQQMKFDIMSVNASYYSGYQLTHAISSHDNKPLELGSNVFIV